MNKDQTDELIEKTHPDFQIQCLKCTSVRVYVENSYGWSAMSGSWGSIDLVCADCDHRVEIFSPQ